MAEKLNLRAEVWVDGRRVMVESAKSELEAFLKRVRRRAENIGFTKGEIRLTCPAWSSPKKERL